MPNNLDLYLDGVAGGLIVGGSYASGTLPTLTRNDTINVRLRLMERDATGVARDVDSTGTTFTFAIGSLDSAPVAGSFKLSTTTGTSGEIAYNAATSAVATAVSAIAGNVTVATYGSSGSAWLITAATANSALSFSGVTFSLFPSSTVRITTRQTPASGVTAAQVLELVRLPAVSAGSFSAAATANVVTLALLQNGATSPAANEIYKLTIGNDAMGGTYSLAYGDTASSAIAYNATPSQVQTALAAVTGVGTGNVSVATAGASYIITFIGDLGSVNVTTALTLNAGGIQYIPFREATVTLSSASLDQVFLEASGANPTPTLEIQVVQAGSTRTLVQQAVPLRKDVIL